MDTIWNSYAVQSCTVTRKQLQQVMNIKLGNKERKKEEKRRKKVADSNRERALHGKRKSMENQ